MTVQNNDSNDVLSNYSLWLGETYDKNVIKGWRKK